MEENIIASLYTQIKNNATQLLEKVGLVDGPFRYGDLPFDMKKEIIGFYIDSLHSIDLQYSGNAQSELEDKIQDIICFSLTNKENYSLVHKVHKPKIQTILRDMFSSWKFQPVQFSDIYGHTSFIMGALLYADAYDKNCTNFGFYSHSPLLYAIKQGYGCVVLNLLKAGANPNYAESNQLGDSYYPLVWALFCLEGKKRINIIRTLLEYGADPRGNKFNSQLEAAELPDHEVRAIRMLIRIAKGDE